MNATDLGNTVLNSWEAGDVAGTASVLADDFKLFGAGPGPLDKQAFLAFQQINNTAFADWKFNHRSVGSNGLSSCFVLQITATHTGPLMSRRWVCPFRRSPRPANAVNGRKNP